MFLASFPTQVVPFILGMFVLVEGLKVQGWLHPLASILSGRLTGTIWKTGLLSVALCAVLNNQPMTILLTTAMLEPEFSAALQDAYHGSSGAGTGGSGEVDGDQLSPAAAHARRGALFALVVGSNVGALWTLLGALAGLM
jgi:Na+/H+ antiporter NhaD/arsenite permease-like protein